MATLLHETILAPTPQLQQMVPHPENRQKLAQIGAVLLPGRIACIAVLDDEQGNQARAMDSQQVLPDLGT
ncbi:hypothetical protein [Phaeovulum sp.]|uniref:hypothetical protein n=1 Tax=Phaeovulum sp. TaxID=2934796 RepID=UPI0039E4FCC2